MFKNINVNKTIKYLQTYCIFLFVKCYIASEAKNQDTKLAIKVLSSK